MPKLQMSPPGRGHTSDRDAEYIDASSLASSCASDAAGWSGSSATCSMALRGVTASESILPSVSQRAQARVRRARASRRGRRPQAEKRANAKQCAAEGWGRRSTAHWPRGEDEKLGPLGDGRMGSTAVGTGVTLAPQTAAADVRQEAPE